MHSAIDTHQTSDRKIQSLLHKTIKKVGEDFENMSFNTSISAMMILLNEIYSLNVRSGAVLRPLCPVLQTLRWTVEDF